MLERYKDIRKEKLLTMAEASLIVPTHPTKPTMWRWCRKGLKGVCLEYIRIGGAKFTSKEALDRFFSAVTAADDKEKSC